VALSVELVEVEVDEVAAGWVEADEVVCARAGKASTAAKGKAKIRRLFIDDFLQSSGRSF
jgi:hypothetical protein